ncbi:MAG TPA: hypothetical protein QGG47_11250 [Acidobacteriota bacterium]|nr:hypothetical protein [Acidobacteriota bacterium]
MSEDEAIRYLDDLIDGTLSAEKRSWLERQLESSPTLSTELSQRRELQARAAELRREIAPPSDLWPGIAAGIEKRKVVRPRFGARRSNTEVPGQVGVDWRRLGSFAAAAMLLIAVSSGITAYLVRAPLSSDEQAGTIAPSEDFVAVAWEGFQAAERSYQEITDELLQALDEHRSDLSPETIRIVEESLRSIDQAIVVARAALERDPANASLLNQLTDMYRKRVTFLREISRL